MRPKIKPVKMIIVNSCRILILTLIILISSMFSTDASAKQHLITVFAASSLLPALTAIIKIYPDKDMNVRAVYASSSTLAKQIAAGAPADIFISAHPQWVDYLENKDLLVERSRKNLLGNRLVVAVPVNNRDELINIENLSKLLDDGRLAVGNPAYVPVGMYAKNFLIQQGLWQKIKVKLARTSSTRAALALIERGEVPAGIVYKTDTVNRRAVKIIYEMPENSRIKIRYPVVRIKSNDKNKDRISIANFYKFLYSVDAAKIFIQYGFDVLLLQNFKKK